MDDIDFIRYEELKAAGKAILLHVGTDVYLAIDDGGPRHKFIRIKASQAELTEARQEFQRARQAAAARLAGFDAFAADVLAFTGG